MQNNDNYAHTREDGAKQLLKDHLIGTAAMAQGFAIRQLNESAYLAGLLHDLGKYSDDFQRRLKGANIHVDHSTCGAKEIYKETGGNLLGLIFAYVVAGHHCGLPDLGNKGENEDETALLARLKKVCPDASAWSDEIELNLQRAIEELVRFTQKGFLADDYEFLIRYLFSCLTDADSLDTERFCSGKTRKALDVDWERYREVVDNKLRSFNAVTQLQKARAILQKQAKNNIANDCGIYLLDMPTGSGKTLCSLSLALERAAKTNKKRIIYVIPYTTIIEQTADEFGKILTDLPILEHYAEFDFSEDAAEALKAWGSLVADDGDVKVEDIIKQRSENWDAPFIITTNVQFFESIYSNKRGKLRKLHNMADSVIVFDEMHTLPVEYFAPCMRAIEQLTTRYNSEAIFLTATMPDFAGLVKRFTSKEVKMFDLVPDKSDYRIFDKCTFDYIGQQDIVGLIDGEKSTLVVCNRKRDAESMYSRCGVAEKYCLSTYLTPIDRKRIIDKIRESLSSGGKPVVFSTSLIEAGVDLDFECVYRELAGIDNILQTAGRCNRNGMRPKEKSKVYIFSGKSSKNRMMGQKADTALGRIDEYGADGVMSENCIKEYFDIIYDASADLMKRKQTDYRVDFAKIAKEFHLIDNMNFGIVIPDKETDAILRQGQISFESRRRLQRHSASVTIYELNAMIAAGVLENRDDGLFVLADSGYYDANTGLKVQMIEGKEIYY